MHIFKNSNFDFLRWRWQAIGLSTLVIAAGLFTIVTRGIPLGVEFSGGTNLIVRFEAPVNEDQIRTALASVPHEVQTYGEPGANQMLIRLPQTQQEEQGANLSADVPRVEQALKASGLPAFRVEGTEIVGPTVGAELRRQAILRDAALDARHHGVDRIPLPRSALRSARLSRRCTTCSSRWRSWRFSSTKCRSTSSPPC